MTADHSADRSARPEARTEAIDPHYRDLDSWPPGRCLEALINSNRRAVDAVAAALPALERAVNGLEQRLADGGRLIYLGAGTSGRLALQDAAELPPTFGFERVLALLAGGNAADRQAREGAEDDEDEARRALAAAGVGARDAVVAIAASGTTPYTVAGARFARDRGAFTVGIANNQPSPLLDAADVAIFLDTGPEVLAGSTRLAAGTAQKVALNALSTATLIRLGGAYHNLMVGMRPQNAKLRHRAVAIVQAATNTDETAARSALERADWRIREAIVMLETGVDRARAGELLAAHRQRVRDAIAAARAR